MSVTVVDQTLMWLGGLADDTEDGVLNLARQIAALRTTAVTAVGRRSGRTLRELRLQHRELKLARRELELRQIQWELLETQNDLTLARDAGSRYLAQLRAVLLSYSPSPNVHVPLAFPRASLIFDGYAIDEDAVEAVLVNNLRISNTTSSRLTDRIPELSRIPR